jgi:MFS family permease
VRFALYTVVHTPVELMAVQSLDAISFSVYAVAGVALLARLTPPKERAWALGVFAAAGSLGPIAGPLLAGALASAVGVQPMLGLATIGAVVVPLTIVVGLWPLLAPRWHGDEPMPPAPTSGPTEDAGIEEEKSEFIDR